jgi:hypothetical protein
LIDYRPAPENSFGGASRRTTGYGVWSARAKAGIPNGLLTAILERDEISLSRHPALAFCLSMIFSDLPSLAEASNNTTNRCHGFAQAGNRFPLFGIMP